MGQDFNSDLERFCFSPHAEKVKRFFQPWFNLWICKMALGGSMFIMSLWFRHAQFKSKTMCFSLPVQPRQPKSDGEYGFLPPCASPAITMVHYCPGACTGLTDRGWANNSVEAYRRTESSTHSSVSCVGSARLFGVKRRSKNWLFSLNRAAVPANTHKE